MNDIMSLYDELELVINDTSPALPYNIAVSVERHEDNTAKITLGDNTYIVNTMWAIGNLKRLPDRCHPTQLMQALLLSNPTAMGVSDKVRREPI